MGEVNSRKLSFNTRKILRNSLPYDFLFFVLLFSPHSFVYNLPLFFPRFFEISHMRVTFDRGVCLLAISLLRSSQQIISERAVKNLFPSTHLITFGLISDGTAHWTTATPTRKMEHCKSTLLEHLSTFLIGT